MSSKNSVELIKKIYDFVVKTNGFDGVMKNVINIHKHLSWNQKTNRVFFSDKNNWSR